MVCEKCEQDKPDTMRRADVSWNGNNTPALCTACCAEMPGSGSI